MRKAAFAILSCVLFAESAVLSQKAPTRDLVDSHVDSLVLAIQDEIYDRGLHKRFFMVGEDLRDKTTRIPLYVQPTLNNKTGWIIYKLMPYGEVFREFDIEEDGLVSFPADVEIGFPATQPSRLTVYMDDELIMKLKQSWRKSFIDIEFLPSASRLKEAGLRQQKRIGFSVQLDKPAPPAKRHKPRG